MHLILPLCGCLSMHKESEKQCGRCGIISKLLEGSKQARAGMLPAIWIWHLNDPQWAVEPMTNGFQLNWELLERWQVATFHSAGVTRLKFVIIAGKTQQMQHTICSSNWPFDLLVLLIKLKIKTKLFFPSGYEDVEQSVHSGFPPVLHRMGRSSGYK